MGSLLRTIDPRTPHRRSLSSLAPSVTRSLKTPAWRRALRERLMESTRSRSHMRHKTQHTAQREHNGTQKSSLNRYTHTHLRLSHASPSLTLGDAAGFGFFEQPPGWLHTLRPLIIFFFAMVRSHSDFILSLERVSVPLQEGALLVHKLQICMITSRSCHIVPSEYDMPHRRSSFPLALPPLLSQPPFQPIVSFVVLTSSCLVVEISTSCAQTFRTYQKR